MSAFKQRRITSNSRGPGQDAFVSVTITAAVTCPKCRGWRLDFDGPHSPRNSPLGRIDCAGDLVVERAA